MAIPILSILSTIEGDSHGRCRSLGMTEGWLLDKLEFYYQFSGSKIATMAASTGASMENLLAGVPVTKSTLSPVPAPT